MTRFAWTTLTLLAAFAQPAAADNLGRIFLTEEDRQKLEIERLRTVPSDSNAGTPGPVSTATDVRDDERDSIGLIIRSDGRKYLWKDHAFVETDDEDPAASMTNPIVVATGITPDQPGNETPERPHE